MRYRKYSDYLVNKYGEKVYKIPVNLPCTCPNRDGLKGRSGCIFCGEQGAGFEAHDASMEITTQITQNIELIQTKYKAKKYIVYFQNYTNTYMKIDKFRESLLKAIHPNVVGLSISTRPDCISTPYLEVLDEMRRTHDLDIEVELGLQSININTLEKINRGHGLAEYIDAVMRIHQFGFSVCTHLIANLPWDTAEDFIEAGRVLSALGVESVKVHSLYVLRGTKLGDAYENGEIEIISHEAYIERLIAFIQNISEEMVIQRFFGRAPEEATLFCNWGMSWRKLQNLLESELENRDIHQGEKYEIKQNQLKLF